MNNDQQLDVKILIGQYQLQIMSLINENMTLKTLLEQSKQKEVKDQEVKNEISSGRP
jgi:hypothetical protein